MTRPPSYHYAAADELLAELAETKPESFKFPFVQAKVQRAQIHALLANSPWYPGVEVDARVVDDDEAAPLLDCRECGYPFNKCAQLWTGQRKCCPDCDHRPPAETRTAKGDYL
ncbi:hypothetical protein SEA_NECROPOLIS_47 [Mycobacterium phage Necropolis]|nr:hypothetical protein SEA_NECROPOLIS_47 [Mycobacterium phage Necropolis]UYL87574.1 hypothetical protein SEA_DYNAMO_48 [Mycobacterium phage Dynamo]